ncbi:MAG: efflux RND transporter periplasmic adaptor subunit [Pseudomonadota bacterium]
MPDRMRAAATAFGVLVVGLGLIALIFVGRPRNDAPVVEAPLRSVYIEVARSAPTRLLVAAQGEVRPRTEISIAAEVAGKIIETGAAFVDGGAFRKDELLVRIAGDDFRYAVTSAEARVAQAAEALRREEAEAELARRDWLELNGDLSQALPLNLREPQLAQARASFAAAKADLDMALLNLQRTEIRAPFQGRLRTRSADIGQYVTPGSAVARIFSTSVAEVRLPLTDVEFGRLGLPLAFVAVPNNPGPEAALSATVGGVERSWIGRIARTDAAIDPQTRQISVIVVVDDPYGAAAAGSAAPLAMGLFVNASISGRRIDRAFRIPSIALRGSDRVMTVDGADTLRWRPVAVFGPAPGGMVVVSGLEDGDRIVVSSLQGVEEGAAVQAIVRTQPEASSPPNVAAGGRS